MQTRPEHDLDAAGLEWQAPPWPLAMEVSNLLAPGSWTLVGGLMVRLRAHLHQLPPTRVTDDVDGTLHLEAGRTTFGEAARALNSAGFSLLPETEFAYRFFRSAHGYDEVVDVMCSDRISEWKKPRFGGRNLFGIPGATRALRETEIVNLRLADGYTAQFSIPSLRGALVLKGAAYLVDSRDTERHLSDGIMLLACVEDSLAIRPGLSRASRKRIRALLRGIDANREVWFEHDPVVRDLALDTLATLRQQFDPDGTDNSAGPARRPRP